MKELLEEFIFLLGFIILACIIGLLFALPTMWLLNWLVPALIPGAATWTITWTQAWGLNILCNILFKGLRNKKDDS